MTRALPHDLAHWIDLESAMLSCKVLVIASFVSRVVDIANDLATF